MLEQFTLGLLMFSSVLFSCTHSQNPSQPHSKGKEQSAISSDKPLLNKSSSPPSAPTANREPAQAQLKSGYRIEPDLNCGGFPQLAIGTGPNFCVGLVASDEDGLKFPRTIVQIPNTMEFVVADMGGWVAKKGRILKLIPSASGQYQLQTLFDQLDLPHGLRVGPDKKIYFGTTTTIYRFDPENPSLEKVITGLPGLEIQHKGAQMKNSHPLTEFVFDSGGNLFVNIGAPSDNCLTKKDGKQEPSACSFDGESLPMAAIWKFKAPNSGLFPTLQNDQQSPAPEIYARGLRNSMGLAIHPESGVFLQAENSRDLRDTHSPFEELNLIEEGQHYGWPYCYDTRTQSAEFENVMSQGRLQNFCTESNPNYRPPYSLVAPHAAPLSITYYSGSLFPELQGHLIMGWHGHQPTGNRVVSYPTDQYGLPLRTEPTLAYEIDCETPRVRKADATAAGSQLHAQPDMIISDWYAINGVRPEGAPVGVTVASDGAIWVVEDKNKAILRIDRNTQGSAMTLPSCYDGESANKQAETELLYDRLAEDEVNWQRFETLSHSYFSKHCTECHSGMGTQLEMNSEEHANAVAKFLLSADSWVVPGRPESSKLHRRIRGVGNEKIMPGNGLELLENPEYVNELDQIDQWILDLGQWKTVQLASSPHLNVRNSQKELCGQILNGKNVLVIGEGQGDMLNFYEIFETRSDFLNGQCSPTEKLFISNCCAQ